MKLFSSAGEQIFNLQSYFTAEQLPDRLQFRRKEEILAGNEGFFGVFSSFYVKYGFGLRSSYFCSRR